MRRKRPPAPDRWKIAGLFWAFTEGRWCRWVMRKDGELTILDPLVRHPSADTPCLLCVIGVVTLQGGVYVCSNQACQARYRVMEEP